MRNAWVRIVLFDIIKTMTSVNDKGIEISSYVKSFSLYIVPVIAVILTAYQLIKSKTKKEISYSIVSDQLLANIHDSISSTNNIKILIDNKAVHNIRLVTLRIRNSGNIPIKLEDYSQSLWFLTSDLLISKKLINSQVTETQPEGIPTQVINIPNIGASGVIGLKNVLLNSGDCVFLYILLSDYSEEIKLYGRIEGVKHIRKEQFVQKPPFNLGNLIGQTIAAIIISILSGFLLALPITFFLKVNILYVGFIISSTFLCIFIIFFFLNLYKRLFT